MVGGTGERGEEGETESSRLGLEPKEKREEIRFADLTGADNMSAVLVRKEDVKKKKKKGTKLEDEEEEQEKGRGRKKGKREEAGKGGPGRRGSGEGKRHEDVERKRVREGESVEERESKKEGERVSKEECEAKCTRSVHSVQFRLTWKIQVNKKERKKKGKRANQVRRWTGWER